MTVPENAERRLDDDDAFERDGDGYRLLTTTFDGRLTVEETDGRAHLYTLTVRAPMLSTAVEGAVGSDLETGWFDTFSLRLEDAPGAVRDAVELTDFEVSRDDGAATVTLGFEWGDADRAAGIAKSFAEYVEGTYMEGVIPGFDYRDPVASMLSTASQGERGGTPL